jgi:hypothetical protein
MQARLMFESTAKEKPFGEPVKTSWKVYLSDMHGDSDYSGTIELMTPVTRVYVPCVLATREQICEALVAKYEIDPKVVIVANYEHVIIKERSSGKVIGKVCCDGPCDGGPAA